MTRICEPKSSIFQRKNANAATTTPPNPVPAPKTRTLDAAPVYVGITLPLTVDTAATVATVGVASGGVTVVNGGLIVMMVAVLCDDCVGVLAAAVLDGENKLVV